uniref:Uncharacterized protein n=1 Tax=Theileria annulata TaxID=5874 RepID=A0A3B0N4V7_THEAN
MEKEYDEKKYIELDLDKFFRENDEFNMLKTLQEMYVSSYKLELEIKPMVTNEIDSVLLCVDTILKMCNLIKDSKNNINLIVNMLNNFNYDETFKESLDKYNNFNAKDNNSYENTINNINNWMNEYHNLKLESSDLVLNEGMININSNVNSVIVDHLHSLSMKNYKFLKDNELLKSYELLLVKIPFLTKLVTNFDDGESNNLNKSVSKYKEIIEDSITLCEFYKKKLKSHCFSNLRSNSVGTVMQSVSVLLLLDGKSLENLRCIINKRLELFKITTNSLSIGLESSLILLFSHILLNHIVFHLLNSFNKDLKVDDFSKMYEIMLLDHFAGHELSGLLQVKNKILEEINKFEFDFPYLSQNSLENGKRTLFSLLESGFLKICTQKITTIISSINVSVDNYMEIESELSNFSEYFDSEHFTKHSTCDEDRVKELALFSDSSSNLSKFIDEKVDSIVDKIRTQVLRKEFKGVELDSLSLYSIQGYNKKFINWMKEIGLLDSILLLSKLNNTENMDKLCKEIAEYYLNPLLSTVVKTIHTMLDQQSQEYNVIDKGGLYMVLLMFGIANLRSYINEKNKYEECKFTRMFEESGLNLAINYYLQFKESNTLPDPLKADASILCMICEEKKNRGIFMENTSYNDIKLLVGSVCEFEEEYSQFRCLLL